ncbi:PASTA domain protein [Micromonospora sp. MW-13]|uniref:PASTA domain-containing protein n=1 Tax=unclassified Micromonospora TaxID=2617518 RepID=UPI000E44488D|nr:MULTISPECIES: PASTA domain-containing protein [unclassified Micromonospora]MCX4469149.1 PASTA domain-containing protein [Micromonospora sp. NBC_01655]RGC68889.1 PASTA domain protein [Micromonospora sp. MW-13]
MTDGNTARETYPGEPGGSGSGRMARVLGGGLAVALLAAVGAAGGWLLADEDAAPSGPSADAGATAPATESPSPTVRTTSPAPRTSAPAPSGGLTVPPVVGTDFEDARDELRDRRLGWRLVFGTGSGRNVRDADPPVGSAVRRGTTVVLHVAGPAPEVSVPDLLDDDCSDAADDLVEEGLYPRYRTGRTGTVTAQDPEPDSTASWNDVVALTCGKEPAEPSGEPAPTP